MRDASFRTDPERSVSYQDRPWQYSGAQAVISTHSASLCCFASLPRLTNQERQSHGSKRFVMMGTLQERIAASALRTFDDLPKKSKPRIHPDGSREWVPMSAVVLVCGIYSKLASQISTTALLTCTRIDANSTSERLTCISLACAIPPILRIVGLLSSDLHQAPAANAFLMHSYRNAMVRYFTTAMRKSSFSEV